MFTLTRISDGQEYTYVNKEEFVSMKENHTTNFNVSDEFSSMLEDMKRVADFIKENKIIEDLDYLIERYYA